MFPFDENRKSTSLFSEHKRCSASFKPWAYLKRFIPAVTVSHGGLRRERGGEGGGGVAWREENKAADRKVSGSAAQGQQVVLDISQLRICKGINYTMLTCKHVRDVDRRCLCMPVKSRGQRLNVNVNELSDEEPFMAGDVRSLRQNWLNSNLSRYSDRDQVRLATLFYCLCSRTTIWIASKHEDHACLRSLLPASITWQVQ